MELSNILLVIAGSGLIMWAILGVIMHFQKQNHNDPIDMFRKHAHNKQIVAVHYPDGKTKFQSYNQDHAESENYISEKEHYRNLLVTQTVGNMDVMHVMRDNDVVAHAQIGEYWNGNAYIPTTQFAADDDYDVLLQKVETPKPVEIEQAIVQHKPGDRFIDIL